MISTTTPMIQRYLECSVGHNGRRWAELLPIWLDRHSGFDGGRNAPVNTGIAMDVMNDLIRGTSVSRPLARSVRASRAIAVNRVIDTVGADRAPAAMDILDHCYCLFTSIHADLFWPDVVQILSTPKCPEHRAALQARRSINDAVLLCVEMARWDLDPAAVSARLYHIPGMDAGSIGPTIRMIMEYCRDRSINTIQTWGNQREAIRISESVLTLMESGIPLSVALEVT